MNLLTNLRINSLIIAGMSLVCIILAGYSLNAASMSKMISDNLYIVFPITLLLATGLLGIGVSFLGIIASLMLFGSLVSAFVIFLAVLWVGSFNSAVLGGVYYHSSAGIIEKQLNHDLKDYNPLIPKGEILYIQNKFHCCGVYGPGDWNSTKHFDGKYPGSCYRQIVPSSNVTQQDVINANWDFAVEDVVEEFTLSNGSYILNDKGCLNPTIRWYRHLFVCIICPGCLFSLCLTVQILLFLNRIVNYGFVIDKRDYVPFKNAEQNATDQTKSNALPYQYTNYSPGSSSSHINA